MQRTRARSVALRRTQGGNQHATHADALSRTSSHSVALSRTMSHYVALSGRSAAPIAGLPTREAISMQ